MYKFCLLANLWFEDNPKVVDDQMMTMKNIGSVYFHLILGKWSSPDLKIKKHLY